jgi:predicted MarR family transcription regulator
MGRTNAYPQDSGQDVAGQAAETAAAPASGPASASREETVFDLGPAPTKAVALQEVELAALSVNHAFHRWIMNSMSVAQLAHLSVADVLVLHQINHRASHKRLADICFILNIEDTRVVAYSLRKLIGIGVVQAERQGKDVTYSATALGDEYLRRYREIREHCLISSIDKLELHPAVLEELAQFLRKMSGLYDQAARAASSF